MGKIQLSASYVKGAIQVMNDSNLLRVIDIVCTFLNSSCKEAEKQKVYQEFVKSFTHICKYDVSDVLYSCASILIDEYRIIFFGSGKSKERKYENIKKLMKKILNDPIFIDGMKKPYSYFSRRWRIPNIVRLLHEFFEEDTILSILRSNTLPRTHFLVFGSHPVLLKDFNLQKKWITFYSKSRLVAPHLKYFYVTDEALRKTSVNVGFNFVDNFLSYAYIEKDNIPSFKLETLIEISSIYSVAGGNIERAERVFYIIKAIQDFPRLALMCK